MSISRRDFMRLFGVSVASLLMTRCRAITPVVTCYIAVPLNTDLPSTPAASPRERLRQLWLGFSDLTQMTISGQNEDNEIGQEWVTEHRRRLDELVANGEISQVTADLVDEAYNAAIYHLWRSNVPITCYEPVIVDYAPSSAGVLVRQSEILVEVASKGQIDPDTLARVQLALEHDLAFFALSEEDIAALYDRLISNASADQGIPSFEELELEVPLEAREAAQFIIDLLSGK